MAKVVTPDDVLSHMVKHVFSSRLLTNVHRSLVVEAIVSLALGGDWEWLGGYASADFKRKDGRLLELKQSSAGQSWRRPDDKPSAGVFDIAARTHSWSQEAGKYLPERSRAAELYVFAHHPLIGPEADHRDPSQWKFYTVKTSALPDQKQIALSRVQSLSGATDFDGLLEHVSVQLTPD